MSKENLRKGLESWIRDTRQVAPEVETWPVAGCKLRRIGTAEIRVPEPRFQVHGKNDLTELKASLGKEGQRFPVRVRLKDGGFELVTGFRRLRACRELGRESLLALVHEEISDDEAERLYLMENLGGADVEGLAVAELIAAHGEDTLREMMVPRHLLERYRPLAGAPAVRGALAEGGHTQDQAMALVETGEADALLDQVVAGRLSVREIAYLGRRRILERAAAEGTGDELDLWAGRISGELGELAEQLEILLAGRDRVSPPGREALTTALEQLDQVHRNWDAGWNEEPRLGAVPDGPAATPQQPAIEPAASALPTAGLTLLAPEHLEDEIRGSKVPVLLHLHLPGHPPSELAELALRGVAVAYEGRVKLCSTNLMTAPAEDDLPRMVKIGRDFLLKNLPCVLLFNDGRKITTVDGDFDTEDLVEVLRSRV